MARVVIQMDRGRGWEDRQAGEVDQDHAAIVAKVTETLPSYCLQYPHRALLDGQVVGECKP